jgi:mannan endo-1,4-beta-mannosidase
MHGGVVSRHICARLCAGAVLAVLATVAAAAPVVAKPTPARSFGVYVDPWHVTDWTRQVGAAPDMVARFEAFSRGAYLDSFLREAEAQGIGRVMISWEPWKPVPVTLGDAQSLPQPGYRNRDILHGVQDHYIRRFARSLATFHGVVYLRYAHEMNGSWYPWSREPHMYVLAWRRVVRLFRAVGARNVRFVWSANPNQYEGKRPWLAHLRLYWPGKHWVDYVGSTMIDFGGRRRARYQVDRFAPRLEILRRVFRKPMMLPETNTEYAGRVDWLRKFRRMLRGMPWIRSVVWSQLQSRGQAHMIGAGELNWNVQTDPAAAAMLRGIIADGRR